MQRSKKNFSKLYVGRLFQIKKYKQIYCQLDSPPYGLRTSWSELGEFVTIVDENPKYVKCLTLKGAVWIKRNYLLKEIINDTIFFDNTSIVDEAVQTITNAIASKDISQLESLLPLLRKIKN